MILRLALRSLLARPARSAVLACGFGLGVAVMASLLGIGEVMLEQARAPALRGGGDVVILGATGQVTSARHVLSSVLQQRAALGAGRRHVADAAGSRLPRARGARGPDSCEGRSAEPRAGLRGSRDVFRGGLDGHCGRRRLGLARTWRGPAVDGSLSPDPGRAGPSGLLGGVAVLQRPQRREPLLSHVPRRSPAAERPTHRGRAAAARSRGAAKLLLGDRRARGRACAGRGARPRDRREPRAPRGPAVSPDDRPPRGGTAVQRPAGGAAGASAASCSSTPFPAARFRRSRSAVREAGSRATSCR